MPRGNGANGFPVHIGLEGQRGFPPAGERSKGGAPEKALVSIEGMTDGPERRFPQAPAFRNSASARVLQASKAGASHVPG